MASIVKGIEKSSYEKKKRKTQILSPQRIQSYRRGSHSLHTNFLKYLYA